MIDDAAFGVQPANTRARIDAPVVGAALDARTVRILDTFRPASGVRISDIIWRAFARDAVSLSSARSSHSARWRVARILRSWRGSFRLDDHRFGTTDERVARHAFGTRTDGIVIPDDAIGVDSASSWARIDTFLVDAGLVLRTITAGHTFGPARSAEIAGQARTDGLLVDWSTFSVRTARIGIARLFLDRFRHNRLGRCKNLHV